MPILVNLRIRKSQSTNFDANIHQVDGGIEERQRRLGRNNFIVHRLIMKKNPTKQNLIHIKSNFFFLFQMQ